MANKSRRTMFGIKFCDASVGEDFCLPKNWEGSNLHKKQMEEHQKSEKKGGMHWDRDENQDSNIKRKGDL